MVIFPLAPDQIIARCGQMELDWHTVQFLSEIINVRDDVFSLDFSDGFTLSCQELNSIVLFLATDRQT